MLVRPPVASTCTRTVYLHIDPVHLLALLLAVFVGALQARGFNFALGRHAAAHLRRDPRMVPPTGTQTIL